MFTDCPSGGVSTPWPTYKFPIQQISSGGSRRAGGGGLAPPPAPRPQSDCFKLGGRRQRWLLSANGSEQLCGCRYVVGGALCMIRLWAAVRLDNNPEVTRTPPPPPPSHHRAVPQITERWERGREWGVTTGCRFRRATSCQA